MKLRCLSGSLPLPNGQGNGGAPAWLEVLIVSKRIFVLVLASNMLIFRMQTLELYADGMTLMARTS